MNVAPTAAAPQIPMTIREAMAKAGLGNFPRKSVVPNAGMDAAANELKHHQSGAKSRFFSFVLLLFVSVSSLLPRCRKLVVATYAAAAAAAAEEEEEEEEEEEGGREKVRFGRRAASFIRSAAAPEEAPVRSATTTAITAAITATTMTMIPSALVRVVAAMVVLLRGATAAMKGQRRGAQRRGSGQLF